MHPIQTAISVREAGGAQLTVTPDRSQAGTSLVDGQIELLVHRRLIADDGSGETEPLNETERYFYHGCAYKPPHHGCMDPTRERLGGWNGCVLLHATITVLL